MVKEKELRPETQVTFPAWLHFQTLVNHDHYKSNMQKLHEIYDEICKYVG